MEPWITARIQMLKVLIISLNIVVFNWLTFELVLHTITKLMVMVNFYFWKKKSFFIQCSFIKVAPNPTKNSKNIGNVETFWIPQNFLSFIWLEFIDNRKYSKPSQCASKFSGTWIFYVVGYSSFFKKTKLKPY